MAQVLGSGTYIKGLPWYEDEQFPMDIIAQESHITITGMGGPINHIPYRNIDMADYGTTPKNGVDDPKNKLFVYVWTGAIGKLALEGLIITYTSIEFKRKIDLFVQMPKRRARKIARYISKRMSMKAA